MNTDWMERLNRQAELREANREAAYFIEVANRNYREKPVLPKPQTEVISDYDWDKEMRWLKYFFIYFLVLTVLMGINTLWQNFK